MSPSSFTKKEGGRKETELEEKQTKNICKFCNNSDNNEPIRETILKTELELNTLRERE